MLGQHYVKIYYKSQIFYNMSKNVPYGIKLVNGNIFEKFEAMPSLVVLNITSVKMRFTKSPPAAMF